MHVRKGERQVRDRTIGVPRFMNRQVPPRVGSEVSIPHDPRGHRDAPSGASSPNRRSLRVPGRITTRTRHCLYLISLLAFTAAQALAQSPVPPGINLFDDSLVKKVEQHAQPSGADALAQSPRAKGAEQVLIFQDERQLSGELSSLAGHKILWRRPDFSEPYEVSTSEISRIALDPSVAFEDNPQNRQKDNAQLSGFVEWGGGNWFKGAVTSNDGKVLNLEAMDVSLKIPWAQMEWLFFGTHPVPDFRLSAKSLFFDGWSGFDYAQAGLANGIISLPKGQYVQRSIPRSNRVDLSFEMPAGTDEGVRVLLFPNEWRPEVFGPGMEKIVLGNKKVTHTFTEFKLEQHRIDFSDRTTNIPPEAQDGAGASVRYRILFDASANRTALYRNGHLAGDWKLVVGSEQAPIQSICLAPAEPTAAHSLQFQWIRLQPWGGQLPGNLDTPPKEDELSNEKTPAISGSLEEISGEALTFSGDRKSPRDGWLVHHASPADDPSTETRISLGEHGRIGVAGLSVAQGQAQMHSKLSKNLTLPLSSISAIEYPYARPEVKQTGSLMVFQNGDAIQGMLLSAESAGPWHWQTAGGQKIDIQPDQIGGVILLRKGSAPGPSLGCVEMQNGDRLCGTFRALTNADVVFDHPLLGALTLKRSLVSTIFVNPEDAPRCLTLRQAPIDAWSSNDTPQPFGAKVFDRPRPYLDGSFVAHPPPAGANSPRPPAVFHFAELPDRYELSFDVLNPSGALPDFMVQLESPGVADPSVRVENDGDEKPNLYEHKDGSNRNIDLHPETGAKWTKKVTPYSRINVRAFIDTKECASHFYFDGLPVAEIGHTIGKKYPNLGKSVELRCCDNSDLRVFSNIRIIRWKGPLPENHDGQPGIELANGDSAVGEIKQAKDGAIDIETELGPLKIAVANASRIVLSGAFSPVQAVARLRLADGSVIHADSFHWNGEELTGHSPTLGDLRIPIAALDELVIHPAPARRPRPLGLTKE